MLRSVPPIGMETPVLPEMQRSRGHCRLSFDGSRPEQQLRLLDQTPPCRVLFPRPAKAGVHEAAIITTTGGMTGGDHITMTLAAQNDARISVSTQSLFDRNSVISIAGSSRFLACEMTVFGRESHGETNPDLDFRDRWRIYRDGDLVWAENFGFQGKLADVQQSRARLHGAGAVATFVIAAPGLDEGLGDIRELLDTCKSVTAAVTSFGDMAVCRIAGRRALDVRNALMSLWLMARQSSLDFGSRLPRVWSV